MENEKSTTIVARKEGDRYFCLEHANSDTPPAFANQAEQELIFCNSCEFIIDFEYTFDHPKDEVNQLLSKFKWELSEDGNSGWLDIYDLLAEKFKAQH